MRFLDSLVLSAMLALFAAPALSAADSAGLEALQGKWSAKGAEGDRRSIEFKGEKITFEIAGADGQTRLAGKGTVKAAARGPFKVIEVSDLQAGRSAEDLQPSDEEVSIIYTFHEGALVLAVNFDKTRERQKPELVVYNRVSSTSRIAGTWKLQLEVADNTFDYTLRVAEKDGNLTGVLVSPRSGEHKAKTIKLNGEAFAMEIDREIEGNPVTFVYTESSLVTLFPANAISRVGGRKRRALGRPNDRSASSVNRGGRVAKQLPTIVSYLNSVQGECKESLQGQKEGKLQGWSDCSISSSSNDEHAWYG